MSAETDCIFCRISAGEFGTEFLYESENVVAFNDLAPVAGTHVLVIPRRHLSSVAEIGECDKGLLAEVIVAANQVAADRGIVESGYRILTNHGKDAGQTVFHLHFHLLGGNELAPIG